MADAGPEHGVMQMQNDSDKKKEEMAALLEALGYKEPSTSDLLWSIAGQSVKWIWIGFLVALGWRLAAGI